MNSRRISPPHSAVGLFLLEFASAPQVWFSARQGFTDMEICLPPHLSVDVYASPRGIKAEELSSLRVKHRRGGDRGIWWESYSFSSTFRPLPPSLVVDNA